MWTLLLLLLLRGSVLGVILRQKPRREICPSGASVTIKCEADSQVTLMFWYRQFPGQSLLLMATANQGSEATYESGYAKDKFPISRPNLTFSTLTVTNTRPEDSSFYYCSAGDTVVGTDQRSQQQLQLPPTRLPLEEPEDAAMPAWGKPQLLAETAVQAFTV